MAARLWIITLAWVLAAPAWAQGFFVSGGAQPLDPREDPHRDRGRQQDDGDTVDRPVEEGDAKS